MKSYRYLLSFIAFCSSFAWTQDAAKLDKVTIQSLADSAFSPFDFSGNHQSIEREAFSSKFTTLPDLLEQQSGIEIHSIGGIGQYASPSIRGSSSQQVLVFWDGMLINSLNGGGANLGNLNLSAANRVDIYRGLAPIELSASAIGGVIHLQSSTDHNHESNGQANITLGSYGVQQYAASQFYKKNANQFFISAQWQQADNDFKYLEQHPVANPNKPQHEKRYNNGSEQAHFLIKNRHQFSDLSLNLALQGNQAVQNLSAAINYPANNAHLDTKNLNTQLSLRKDWSKYVQTEVLTHVQKQTQIFDDRDSRIGLGAQWDEYATTGYRIQLNQYVTLNRLNLVFTSRFHQEDTDTNFKLLSAQEAEQQCLNGYACETSYQRSQLDNGVRLQYWLNNTGFSVQASNIQIKDKNLDLRNQLRKEQANTWYAAVQQQFSQNLHAYINISQQLRLPATHELFGDRGTSKGNPQLQAEQSLGYELGAELNLDSWSFKNALYWRDLDGAIIAESDSRGVIHFSNLARSRHLGFEQNITWQATAQLELTANFTIQSNEIIKHSSIPYYQGNQAAGLSPLHSFLNAKWRSDFWDFNLSHNYLYGGYYTNSNTLKKDTENRIDVAFGLFNKTWRLSLSINDLTNNAARDFPSYPEPGRMYFVRLNYQW